MFLSNNFRKYVLVGGILTIISTFCIVVLVDLGGIWVGYANPIVVFIIFLIRYVLLKKVGMLSSD